MENIEVVSGSCVVNNPFILGISGANFVASPGAGMVCVAGSEAIIYWAEIKPQH